MFSRRLMEIRVSFWVRPILLSAVLVLAGCADAPSRRDAYRERGYDAPASRRPDASAYADPGVSFAPWTSEDYRYRIGAGDELSLRFLINPDLNTTVVVGPDGRGVFPLISAQPVAGLTAEEANIALTNAYAQVLRAPHVEALIATYGSSQIYVGGEVRDPGVKPIKGQLTVAQAVMAAGGFQETARTGKVVLIRQRLGDPRLLMRTIDVRATLAGQGDGAFAVLPGDLIFVPRSAIAEVNLFIRQYVTGALPFNFNYSINRGNRF
jgi:protein involved in polysaccharide export with SLBB domain